MIQMHLRVAQLRFHLNPGEQLPIIHFQIFPVHTTANPHVRWFGQ